MFQHMIVTIFKCPQISHMADMCLENKLNKIVYYYV